MSKNKPSGDEQSKTSKSRPQVEPTERQQQPMGGVLSRQPSSVMRPQTSSILSRQPSSTLSRQPSTLLQRSASEGTESEAATGEAYPQIRTEGRNFAQFVGQTGSPQRIQPKLMVGPVGDKYEQEADRVAAQVMSAPPRPMALAQRNFLQVAQEEGQAAAPKARQAGATAEAVAAAMTSPVQRDEFDEEKLQANQQQQPVQKKENNTGLPDTLKTGMEGLSGMSLDDIKVHRNSDKPAQLQAHAYAQGTDIHLGPGQEKHLPHEAWHVVQQKQGRVKPTMQMKGKVHVNDDAGLEKEADIMGKIALSSFTENDTANPDQRPIEEATSGVVTQLKVDVAMVNKVLVDIYLDFGSKNDCEAH